MKGGVLRLNSCTRKSFPNRSGTHTAQGMSADSGAGDVLVVILHRPQRPVRPRQRRRHSQMFGLLPQCCRDLSLGCFDVQIPGKDFSISTDQEHRW